MCLAITVLCRQRLRSSRESDEPSRHGHYSESFGSTSGVSGVVVGNNTGVGTLQPLPLPSTLLCHTLHVQDSLSGITQSFTGRVLLLVAVTLGNRKRRRCAVRQERAQHAACCNLRLGWRGCDPQRCLHRCERFMLLHDSVAGSHSVRLEKQIFNFPANGSLHLAHPTLRSLSAAATGDKDA